MNEPSIPSSTPDKSNEGVLKKSIRAGQWIAADFAAQRAISLLPFLILARLLTPNDFGLAAIILLVPKFLQTTSEHGLAIAAVQKGGDVRKYLNPIWTVNILRGFAIAAIVALVAPVIANFYHVPEYVWPIRFSGLIVLIRQFSNIGEVWIVKELDFKKIFIRNCAKYIVYALVTISIAVISPSYWAIIIGTLCMQATETIASYFLQPYRPRLSRNFGVLRELTGFSKWISGQILVDQLYGFAENSIVARATSTTAVGFYTKAKNFAAVTSGFFAGVISIVTLPAFSRIKDSAEKVREGFKKSMDILFVTSAPLLVLVIAAGGKLVLILLGQPWLSITTSFRLFILYFTITNFVDISYKLLNSIGYPDKKVKFDSIKIPLSIVLLFFGVRWYGPEGAVGALILGMIPVLCLTVQAIVRHTEITYWNIIARFCFPLITAILLFLPFAIWKEHLMGFGIITLCLLGGLYLALYSLTIAFIGIRFKRGPYHSVALIVRTVLRRREKIS